MDSGGAPPIGARLRELLAQALGAGQAQPPAHLQLALQPQSLPQLQRSGLALAQPQDAFSQLQRF